MGRRTPAQQAGTASGASVDRAGAPRHQGPVAAGCRQQPLVPAPGLVGAPRPRPAGGGPAGTTTEPVATVMAASPGAGGPPWAGAGGPARLVPHRPIVRLYHPVGGPAK